MTDEPDAPTRKSLVFLEALIAATPEELRDMNKAISAARAAIEARAHLPGGAEVVIAEALADHEIARMLELLEKKRRKAHRTAYTGYKGTPRPEILATAQRKREQRAAELEERQRQRDAITARRKAEKRERQRQREQRRRSDRPPAKHPSAPHEKTRASLGTGKKSKKNTHIHIYTA